MNIFELDYLKCTTTLLKEAFSFKKYCAMNTFWAVIIALLMLPFIISSLFLGAYLIFLTFMFKAFKMPIDFLHDLVNKEGKEVKHATQAVLYLISWPWVFLLYAMLSLSLVSIILCYAVLSLLTYLWSLGGFRFHAFIGEAKDSISVKVNGTYSALSLVAHVAVCCFLFLIGLICAILAATGTAGVVGIVIAALMYSAYLGWTVLYGALVLCRKPAVIEEIAETAQDPTAHTSTTETPQA